LRLESGMADNDQTQTPEQRDYTLSELDQAVAADQITQQQRDQIWQTQIERKAVKSATAAATQIVETQSRENNLDGQLQQYAEIAPDLMREGSPLRSRVADEFEFLVNQGAPRNLTTELAAARAVMGPLERAKSRAGGRARGADMSADTYGSQPMSRAERRDQDAFSKLTPAQRQHAEKLVNMGLYADRGAYLAELNWKRGGKRGAA
jgi:hypothetical protein